MPYIDWSGNEIEDEEGDEMRREEKRRDGHVIPMSDVDMYHLLIAAAPDLIMAGESRDTEDPVNDYLLAWWNGCNGLEKGLRIELQNFLRKEFEGKLPEAPWEDANPDGTVISRHVSEDTLTRWAQAMDDSE